MSEKNAAGETWEHTYDARGNRVKTIDPAGNETTWVYRGDLLVRRITPDGLITSIASRLPLRGRRDARLLVVR